MNRACKIPRTTFQGRVSGKVTGTGPSSTCFHCVSYCYSFALKPIQKDSFILEYRGVLKKNVTANECTYSSTIWEGIISLMHQMKMGHLGGRLFAIVDIEEGQEVTYDYGGGSLLRSWIFVYQPCRFRETAEEDRRIKVPGHSGGGKSC
ncbi:uncharacterized protein V6R79_015116 [Siganus canaliculatus]